MTKQSASFVNVGERTNVTGSAKFRKLIEKDDYTTALDIAREQVENGAWRVPSPIGFYFAKLWYFEKLYPMIATVGALTRLTNAPKS